MEIYALIVEDETTLCPKCAKQYRHQPMQIISDRSYVVGTFCDECEREFK